MKNDFKAFATGQNANVTEQEAWENLPALLAGFQSGKASSAQVNKALRQSTFIAAALAQFVSDKSGTDVLDDGDIQNFISKLSLSFGSQYLSRKNPFADIKSDGSDAVAQALKNLGLVNSSGVVGRLINIQVFTQSGVANKTPGAEMWKVRALGAGGGSSAAQATGDGEVSISCGGAAGAYAEGYYDVPSINSLKVVVGKGGKAGDSSDIYGGAGGASSVDTLIYVPGGPAGLPAGPAKPPFSPVGNTNSNSPTGWNIVGTSGPGAELAFAASLATIIISRGANSQFGVGGAIPAVNSPATAGGGFGCGASGCANSPNKPVTKGEVGRGGIVIIEEYA